MRKMIASEMTLFTPFNLFSSSYPLSLHISNELSHDWCLEPLKELILFLAVQPVIIVLMGMETSMRRLAIGFLRNINLCEWSNGDHRVSFCIVIFSSFGWNSLAITWVKVSLRHVFSESIHKVSSRLISANNVRAPHTMHLFFHSSNAELGAFFPDDLREVACAAWKSPVVEVIARFADLIVPITVIVICEKLISDPKTY